MNQPSITVTIDGHEIPLSILDQFEYQRTVHGLHELKRLGVQIMDGERELSDIDINWLEPERAKQISVETRAALGEQKVLEVFADVLRDTDERWKAINSTYDPARLHKGTIEIVADGVGLPETMAVLGGAKDERAALAVMPDHYIVIGDITSGQRGMEVFGMLGEPAYVHGTGGNEVPDALAGERDESFPVCVCGEMLLKSDDTPMHLGALHQMRPAEHGFSMRSTFFCSADAPKAVAEGHKIHFAIEICNSIRTAFAAQQA